MPHHRPRAKGGGGKGKQSWEPRLESDTLQDGGDRRVPRLLPLERGDFLREAPSRCSPRPGFPGQGSPPQPLVSLL